MNEIALRLCGVCCAFGAVDVLDNLTLSVRRSEFVAIVGPSGSGKTTLLGILSGFLKATAGTVERSGTVRTVYQADGLFPWLTVRQNIALGVRGLPAMQQAAQIEAMLSLIGLEGFADHYPHQLSGGMRQRVEIARALCGETDILLLDEPFSALDYLTRLRMRQELTRLLSERPRTVVLVTHDIEEAAQLADRVLVLSDRPARIHQELRIPEPRPRDVTSPAVVSAVHAILSALGLER